MAGNSTEGEAWGLKGKPHIQGVTGGLIPALSRSAVEMELKVKSQMESMKKEKRRGADCAGSLIPGDTGRGSGAFLLRGREWMRRMGQMGTGMDWMDQTDQMRWTATKI